METIEQIRSAKLIPPQVLTLMLTNRCNLRCRHCWPDSLPDRRIRPVHQAAIFKIVREFMDAGIEKLVLTGGEPLMHPDWFEIMAFACGQRELEQVHLQTNATLFTKAPVEKLLGLDSQKLFIQIGLEGATPEIHDHVRGSGSFDSTLEGIHSLIKAGFKDRIQISLTETRQNFSEIPAVLNLLDSLGISSFNSRTLMMQGRAKTSSAIALPEPAQYKDLVRMYRTDSEFGKLYGKSDSYKIAALEWSPIETASPDSGCRFMENPLISAEGTLYPCALFQIEAYGIGNLYQRPLTTTLNEILPKWSKLQRISRLRADRLKECAGCPGRPHCRGGCMGRAYSAHGKLMSTEDRCRLRQTVYSIPNI